MTDDFYTTLIISFLAGFVTGFFLVLIMWSHLEGRHVKRFRESQQ